MEGFGYGFDALVAFVLFVALGVWYPGRDSLDEGDEDEGLNGRGGHGGGRSGDWWFGKGRDVGAGAGANRRRMRARGSSVRMEGFPRA